MLARKAIRIRLIKIRLLVFNFWIGCAYEACTWLVALNKERTDDDGVAPTV
jgi:hypothetical protein